MLVALGIALLFGEIYVRTQLPHGRTEIRKEGDRLTGFVDWDPGLLTQQTPLGPRLVPNVDVVVRKHFLSGRDVRVRTGTHGFRGQDVKDDGRYRILVLGDSITLADYLPEEETWVRQMEAALGSDRHHNAPQVVNAGISGITMREAVDLLEEKGLGLQPDLVVLGFYLNDGVPPPLGVRQSHEKAWLRRTSRFADFAAGRFQLLLWRWRNGIPMRGWADAAVRFDWRWSPDDFASLADAASYDWGIAWQLDSWEGIELELARLAQFASANNFRVAVLVFPVLFQVYAEHLPNEPQRMVGALSRKYGLVPFDLLPVLRAAREHRLFLPPHARGQRNSRTCRRRTPRGAGSPSLKYLRTKRRATAGFPPSEISRYTKR